MAPKQQNSTTEVSPTTCWLMKAEPETRIEKGKDVKFSVDDFEAMKETPWDGVRNHEAKNIMKERMKLGHKVLFYHSNCKVPGIYGLAEVCKEGYPDSSAWDASHPYFDAKTNKESPTWFRVDIAFKSRLQHPVTLSFLKYLASLSSIPSEISGVISQEDKAEIQKMALINRGRLSVQPVTEEAYQIIVKLGENGGFEFLDPANKPKKSKVPKKEDDEKEGKALPVPDPAVKGNGKRKKRESEEAEGAVADSRRKSSRSRK